MEYLSCSVDRVPGYMLGDIRSADVTSIAVVAHFDHSAILSCKVLM